MVHFQRWGFLKKLRCGLVPSERFSFAKLQCLNLELAHDIVQQRNLSLVMNTPVNGWWVMFFQFFPVCLWLRQRSFFNCPRNLVDKVLPESGIKWPHPCKTHLVRLVDICWQGSLCFLWSSRCRWVAQHWGILGCLITESDYVILSINADNADCEDCMT